MRVALIVLLVLLAVLPSSAGQQVTKVDFLAPLGLKVNAAGPLLVRLDAPRQRLVVANTLSSSVTLIDCRDRSLRNIPVATRVPQHLKSEALAIDGRSGNAYVIGDHSLAVVFSEAGTSRCFPTGRQFEMVAVDEASGNAFLVGRESREMAVLDLKRGRLSFVAWTEGEQAARNLNQTPPPPLRKVVCDSAARLVAAIDGGSATLHLFHADSLRPLGRRPLDLAAGGRWHYAGYSPRQQAVVLVVETTGRKVIQAAKISLAGAGDTVVPLPGLSEGVGIGYSEERDEVYIPYDNHPSLHVVDFKRPASACVDEVMLPAYGNDATAVAGDFLYVASWAWGEIDQVDLATRRLRRRFLQVPVLPHMFNMAVNPADGRLYIPLGATAVNGAFGAAVTVFDPASGAVEKIRTGWAPQEMVQRPGHDEFLFFNNEDQLARVAPDGGFSTVTLPVDYPHQALATPQGWVCLSYGPHQSYWPVVYIWAARNGILGINGGDLSFYDRRLPRLAQAMALSPAGALFALQNNWGDEKQFYATLADEVRAPNLGDMRVELEDTVSRETTQRLIAYDADRGWLLIARAGEGDGDSGILQVVDAKTGKTLRRLETGVTPTALAVDRESIFVANFGSDSLSVFAKKDFSRRDLACGRQPLKIALSGGVPYIINHGDNTLCAAGAALRRYRIPFPGTPDQISCRQEDGLLLITSHSAGELFIYSFDPRTKRFSLHLREAYPYGGVSFAGDNSAFYLRGQFGDCLYDLCHIRWPRQGGAAWVSDFLAGKAYIVPLAGR
jgi:DNA-binding beta-propeller fold protein YncE